MEMLSVSLDLRGRLVLVVGGGKVASKRIRRMLDAGASMTLVSPELDPDVAKVVRAVNDDDSAEGSCVVRETTWQEFDASNTESQFALVCACTDESEVNDRVAEFGDQIGAFVNRVDIGRASNMHFKAESCVGDIRMTIATGGAAPVVSRAMRTVFEDELLPHWARRASEVSEFRMLAKELPSGRRSRFWATLRQRLVETQGDDPDFHAFAIRLLKQLSNK